MSRGTGYRRRELPGHWRLLCGDGEAYWASIGIAVRSFLEFSGCEKLSDVVRVEVPRF